MNIRRRINLPESENRLLEEQSRKTGLPVDELIRQAIRHQLGSAAYDPRVDDHLFDGEL